MQPSVIWIGEAEKMFYKKVPKEEKEVFLSKMLNMVLLVWQLKARLCALFVCVTRWIPGV